MFSWFVFSKTVDFLDTVFMVLKKDHKRMTYFHVYHHSSIMFSSWMGSVFAPGKFKTYIAFFNLIAFHE